MKFRFLVLSLLLLNSHKHVQAQSSPSDVYEFSQEVEKKAYAIFQIHKSKLPSLNESTLQKMLRVSLKQQYVMLKRAKEIQRFVSPAAKTFFYTNIASTFIVPPILTALGQPGLAMLVIATPFEPVVAAGQVILMQLSSDVKLLFRIGMKDYLALKKYRAELLGMTERSRVITLMQNELLSTLEREEGDKWVVISKRAKSAPVFPNELRVSELEEIVRNSPEGKAFLQELKFEKVADDFVAVEMWAFIQENEDLKKSLKSLLDERYKATKSKDPGFALQMHQIRDLKNKLLDKEEELTDTIKKVRKAMIANPGDQAELKLLSEEIKETTQRVLAGMASAENSILYARLNEESSKLDLKPMLALGDTLFSRYGRAIARVEELSQNHLLTVRDVRVTLGFEASANDCSKNFQL